MTHDQRLVDLALEDVFKAEVLEQYVDMLDGPGAQSISNTSHHGHDVVHGRFDAFFQVPDEILQYADVVCRNARRIGSLNHRLILWIGHDVLDNIQNFLRQ